MATIRTFDPLTAAQVELAQRRQATGGDPLSSLIGGFTQGVDLQQLPAQLQQQALTNQLKAQLAQQQLQDLQNPEAALQRRIREAIAIQQSKPIEVGNNLLQYDPVSKQYKSVYSAPSASGRKGFFDQNSGRWVEEVNGQMVATKIPFAESIGVTPSAPVSIPDVSGIGLNVDPSLSFGVTPSVVPNATQLPEVVLPSAPTAIGGTLEQRAKTAEDLKKEEQAFRKELQTNDQTFRAAENKLQREYLKGKSEGPEGVYTKQQQASVNQLYDRFNRNDYVKKAQSAQSSVDIILQGLSQNNSTGDIAAINQFQSGLVDPGATVREGDVTLIRNASPVLARLQNYLPQLLKGGVLPPQMRDEMKKISVEIYNMRAKNAMDIPVKQFRNNAQNAGIQFEDIGQEFNFINEDGSPRQGNGQTTRKIGRFELIQ